jgi:hypothetical protein
MNQRRFLRHPTELFSYSYEIIIKCEGCSHEELQALVVALSDVELYAFQSAIIRVLSD